MKTLEAEEEVLQLQWDLAMKEKEAELAEIDLEISMHQDNVERLTKQFPFKEGKFGPWGMIKVRDQLGAKE